MKKKKHGFTLAEVLVTLMIIGVIASMTIPGIKKSTDERQNIAGLKKAYSTIANATNMLTTEYGPIKRWGWASNDTIMNEMYIKQFNVAKNCKNEGGCFDSKYNVLNLDGSAAPNPQSDSSFYTFVAADGAFWSYYKLGVCSGSGGHTGNSCGWFVVDVNGLKGPNTIGIDIFGFTVAPDGAYPMGGCPGCTDVDCKPKHSYGWACTSKLIKDGEYSW